MKPNIFLLIIDSVRADRFYGPKKTAITLNFDNIIKKGIFLVRIFHQVIKLERV